MTVTTLSLIGVLAIAGLHVAAGHLHGGAAKRPAWMNAASGLSVAYVFVHLLPDLAEANDLWLAARPERALYWLESQVYVTTLLGVIVALGLARVVGPARRRRFWLHIASFAVYNALIGAFALRLSGVLSLILGAIAFGAHFLVNDHSLQMRYGGAYVRFGRWILAASIVVGWFVAVLWKPSPVLGSAVLGLVAGGIIINVIKEELPDRGRFYPWVAGTVVYAAVLLALEYSLWTGEGEPRPTETVLQHGAAGT